MCKKAISVLLVLMIIVSSLSFSVTSVSAQKADPSDIVSLSDGYYLITEPWTAEGIKSEDAFSKESEDSEEYYLDTTLKAGQPIKVAKLENGGITANYPDQDGGEYTVDNAHSGEVRITFSPNYSEELSDFGGYFTVAPKGFTVTLNDDLYHYDDSESKEWYVWTWKTNEEGHWVSGDNNVFSNLEANMLFALLDSSLSCDYPSWDACVYQTRDLYSSDGGTFTVERPNGRYLEGTWDIEPTQPDTAATTSPSTEPENYYAEGSEIYFKPNANWRSTNGKYAASFYSKKTNNSQWTQFTAADRSGYYKTAVPGGEWDRMVFHVMEQGASEYNWSNEKYSSQYIYPMTDDSNCFVMEENKWDNGTGSWVKYEPATSAPTTAEQTTVEPATEEPTTAEPTTAEPATEEPTTAEPATEPGEEKFYICGYINGSDYSDIEQSQYPEEFEFKNGKNTITILEDSYVFIATDSGKKYFMNDWNDNAAKATMFLFESEDQSRAYMYVRRGTIVTFTLVDNGNGTFELSYEKEGYPEDTAYYLYGYINGTSYDYDNTEVPDEYKFVNGKLTTTIYEDSYVFVKSNYGRKYYMKDWDENATQATLYSDEITGESGAYMYVRRGTVVTFMLDDNGDNTLELSYEAVGYPDDNAYYLYGYINGTSYDYDDTEVPEEYKFVNGKLTINIYESSYVFIKTNYGRKYYMKDWDEAATEADFLEEKVVGEGGAYMYIPFDSEVTFTLTENNDGSLRLSYTIDQELWSSVPAQYPISGTTGDCTWTLEENGTLTLSGSGKTDSGMLPFAEKIKKVIVKGEVDTVNDELFMQCRHLTEVVIEDGVRAIGKDTFGNCEKLTKLTLGNGLESLDDYAFSACDSLESIEMPDSLKTFGDYVFQYCYKLKNVRFPKGIEEIPRDIFHGCVGLTDIVIPDTVKKIASSAFQGCSGLKNVTIPSSVTSIGGAAFERCSSLETIEIPDSVTSIGGDLFYYCVKLKNVKLPKNISKIPYCLFYKCGSLEEIDLPDGITTIGGDAFADCTALKKLELPDSVTSIENYLCSGCTALQSVKLPRDITTIPTNSFYKCSSLSSVVIPSKVTSIGSSAFNGCSNLTDIDLPEGLKTIGESSFENCTSLKRAEIPETLSSFDKKAFAGCSHLEKIKVASKNTAVGESAFVSGNTLTFYGYSQNTPLVSFANNNGNNFEDISAYTADDHVHEFTEIVYEPTCTEQGYTLHVCTDCEFSYKTDYVSALGHSYTTEVTSPTCTQKGYTTYTCTVCNHSYKGDYTDMVEHTYTTKVTPPTCISKGFTSHTCTVCKYSYKTDYVPELGHKYTTKVTPPTCTQKGYTTYTCTVCSHSYEGDYTDALGHKYSTKVTPPTCTEKGYTTYTCTVCDHSYKGDYTDTIPHTYTTKITPPTCTKQGYTTYTCSVCSHSYKGDYTDALGHSYTTKVTPPTCTQKGYTTYTCSVCSHRYKGDYTDALGHSYGEWVVDEAATVISEGHRHRLCTVCSHADEEIIERTEVGYNTDSRYGLAELKVVNAQTQEPVKNAHIYVSTPNDGEGVFHCDANGKASFVMPVGTHNIAVYADGCITRNLSVTINNGKNEIAPIGLSSRPTYSVELKHHIMDSEEIKEANINVDAQDNNHVSKYEVKIDFHSEIDFVSIVYYMGESGKVYNGGGTVTEKGGDTTQPVKKAEWVEEKNTATGGYIYIPPVKGEPATKIYPNEHFYLIIRGETKWLKEMFDVEMLIINNSATDTLENLTATLELPDGLSLAELNTGEQSESVNINKIAESGSRSLHWYVRGDKSGSYDVKAKLQGKIMPFNEEINEVFEADNQLQVWAENALRLNYDIPKAAYYGEDYPVTVTLENVSNITLYNISQALQVEQEMEISLKSDDKTTRVERSEWNKFGVKEFKPGDKLIFKTTTNIIFESSAIERTIGKITGFIDGAQKLLKIYHFVKEVIDTFKKVRNVFTNAGNTIKSCIEAMDKFSESDGEINAKIQLFKELQQNISKFAEESKSTSGNEAIDAIGKMENSGLTLTLNALTADPDKWFMEHGIEDIKNVILNIKSARDAVKKGVFKDDSKKEKPFDLLDSFRTMLSAIPVRYAVDSVTVTGSDTTVNIPTTYTVGGDTPHYFGVTHIRKYMAAMLSAALGTLYESLPYHQYFHLIPGADDPFTKNDAIKYIQATEEEIERVKAKDATGEVQFKAWIERNGSVVSDSFDLSSDSENAVTENGMLIFIGDANIYFTPRTMQGGTLIVESSEGTRSEYEISVSAPHTCQAGECETVFSPTSEHSGFAVKRCQTCGDVMEVVEIDPSDLCAEHSFGDWSVTEEANCTHSGMREHTCTKCGFVEYDFTSAAEHSFEVKEVVGHTCTEQGYTVYKCTVCGEEKKDDYTAAAHTPGEWEYTKEPTETTGGMRIRHCTACGELTDTEILEPFIQQKTRLLGDVNGDGKIDEADVQMLRGFARGSVKMNAVTAVAADVNGDRTVDKNDVDALSAYLENPDASDKIGREELLKTFIGDMNGDGAFNIADATMVQLLLAGSRKSNSYLEAIGDINGDGVFNINDATQIQKILAGVIAYYPAIKING